MTDRPSGSTADGITAPSAVPVATFRSAQVRLFWLLWTGYAAYYLCRVNFAVAQPALLREFPQWSATQIGLIPSVYAVFYALGQFLNGQLGERFGARRMMTLALATAAITNLLFSLTSSFSIMLVLWAVNGYAQSAGWPLVVKVITAWTSREKRGLVVGLISTCYQVGNVVSWLLAGWMCSEIGWRAAFYVPSLILVPVAIAVGWRLRDEPRLAGHVAPDEQATRQTAPTDAPAPATGDPGFSGAAVLRATLANRILWVLALAYFCMNAVRYAFMNWAVQYMADFHQRSIKASAFTAIALPLIGSVGAIFSGWASDRLFGKRRAPVCAIMLLGLAGVCIAFVQVPAGAWLAATALLGLAGFLIYGPDMLMSGAATADVHPKAAAAATGFTMAMGATGAIFSGVGVGWLKDRVAGDWSLVFTVLAGLATTSALLMVTLWNARPKPG